MKKRTLKFGGKSGILPEVRPVFKRFPIRPPTEKEKAERDSIEQGYAEGIPLPQKKGFTFTREPRTLPVVSVEERIKKNIEEWAPQNVDESKLTKDQRWELKRDQIRREYLKEAYLTEAKRLKKLEELREKHDKSAKSATKKDQNQQESEATRLTLPTIDSYLEGPLMRRRTAAEETILEEQRTLNRKNQELKLKETKAVQLLELYHSAAKFITNEDELQEAIHQAFEVEVGRFESNLSMVDERIKTGGNTYTNLEVSTGVLYDHAFGEIKGKPGLQAVKDSISGRAQKLKNDAELATENAGDDLLSSEPSSSST